MSTTWVWRKAIACLEKWIYSCYYITDSQVVGQAYVRLGGKNKGFASCRKFGIGHIELTPQPECNHDIMSMLLVWSGIVEEKTSLEEIRRLCLSE